MQTLTAMVNRVSVRVCTLSLLIALLMLPFFSFMALPEIAHASHYANEAALHGQQVDTLMPLYGRCWRDNGKVKCGGA